MIPLHTKFPSGKTLAVRSPLPIAPDVSVSVVLIGSSEGFLSRFLSSGILRKAHAATVYAPRIVSVPGRPQKAPNPGTAEAMEARKSGLTRTVVFTRGQTAKGDIVDVTPMMTYARQTLWQMAAVQRHALVRGAMSAWIGEPPDTGYQLTFVELPAREASIKNTVMSIQKMGDPVDHFVFELARGAISELVLHNPENVFFVSPDCKLVVRIDSSAKATDTRVKIVSALHRAEEVFAGDEAPSADGEDEEAEGAASDEGFDVDALAGQTTGERVRQPVNRAAVARRAEQIVLFAKEQQAVLFKTRSGADLSMGSLMDSRPAAPIVPRKAKGIFPHASVAKPHFDAISLSYLNSGSFDRDTAAVISSLAADPLVPHYVQSVERINTSDSMNLKETLRIQYRSPSDERGRSGRSTTVHIDVPIMTRDGYMVMNGNKYSVTKQILASPIIKVRPDEVLVTTAYNKATVERFGQNASAASSYVRLLAGRIDKERPTGAKVELASASAANSKYRSTVEYDDVARTVRSVRAGAAGFVFSRPALETELAKIAPWAAARVPVAVGAGGHAVGWLDGGKRVIGVTADGSIRLVGQASVETPETDLPNLVFEAVSAACPGASLPSPAVPQRKYAYSRVKMLSQYLPTSVIVGYNLGLVPMLERAGIEYQIVDAAAFRRGSYQGKDFIRFSDGIVVFNPKRIRDSLLMNGLKELETEEEPMVSYVSGGIGWVDHIADRLGGPGHAKALVNYQTSFIDPMTRDLLLEDKLPTDMAGVLMYASNLLEDNEHSEPNDMRSYRLRGPELVNTILYKTLHREMERVRATRESASPQKLMVNQADVMRAIQGASNVEEVSELNPLLEVELRGKATWTGAAGGLGDGRTVNRAMRAFHPSMHGIFGFHSPDSSEIGVKRTLAYGASVKDVRGRFDHDIAKSGAAQVLALGELISPFSSQHSDPPRIAMQSKQATHTMPIRKHTPMLVGSGAEKSLASAIGNTFAYKGRANGVVESINTSAQLIKLRYDDGETAYVDMSPRSVKNSGGGFYITAQLEANPGVVAGHRFEEGDILAHDPTYFSALPDGSTAYKSGLLVRTAIVALDQTYEDSLMVTEKLVRDTAAMVTMARSVSLGAKTNLQTIAKVGDVVDPNSALAIFENVTDDADISELLQKVGAEFNDAISDLTRNTAVSKYAGRIVEIRVYYNKEIEELSPSLQKFLKSQSAAAEGRKRAGAGAPADEPVRANAPVRITRDKFGGELVEGVLIMFMIQVENLAAAGDKYVCSAPLKGIISRVLEKGEEPFDEDGEQIDYIMSPLSIVSRMTSDAFLSMWTNSVLVDLRKRVLAIAAK